MPPKKIKPKGKKKGSIIAIVGTKGGVGKSTVSMGTAIWISNFFQDQWSLLVDGDIHVRTVELKMCPGTDVRLAEVLEGTNSLEDAIYLSQLEADGELLYPNLAILPAGGRFLPPLRGNPVDFLNRIKEQFGGIVNNIRRRFRYTIIDTPASVSFEHLILTATADKVIYVVEPSRDSVSSTLQTARGLQELMGIDPLGVVINRLGPRANPEMWIDRASKIAPVLGVVPQDETVNDAFREDLPVVTVDPTCPASQAIHEITRKIVNTKLKPTDMSKKLDYAISGILDGK